MMLSSGEVYFFYEDHIGRPVLVSEYADYDSDGSYFTNSSGYPYWQAVYDPYGSVIEDFDSTGITIGNPSTTGITWSVPFRFPGQYQDNVVYLYNAMYYNWHRHYMPTIGRYNRADPESFNPEQFSLNRIFNESSDLNPYFYVKNNSLMLFDLPALQTGTSGTASAGYASSCKFYADECRNTTCNYPCLAIHPCKAGYPPCGSPNSDKNRCIRRCLIIRYDKNKSTPGCNENKKCHKCPRVECIYYDHNHCFNKCGCWPNPFLL